DVRTQRIYSAYRLAETDPAPALAARAWTRCGPPVRARFEPTGGGSDASVFNARGISSVVLSCGYMAAHSSQEHVALADLVAGAEWVVAIAREAAEIAEGGLQHAE
ncbi:MAG: M20/M25/M40 family metallo-hydrolase, partial [Armatimonadetes bacterium]|nr:M20/M25/M40 family metallo-hydrolase [Armatimonadota bacterium]